MCKSIKGNELEHIHQFNEVEPLCEKHEWVKIEKLGEQKYAVFLWKHVKVSLWESMEKNKNDE